MAWWVHLGVFAALLLMQVSLLPGIGTAGVRPDLVLVWAVSVSILEGREKIALGIAACGGMMVDLTVGRFLGLNTFLFTTAAMIARRALRAFMRPSLPLAVAVTAVLAVVAELVRGLLWHSGVSSVTELRHMISIALTAGGLSGAAAIPLYYLLARATGPSSWEKS